MYFKYRSCGFSLIEVMVAVGVAGVLAAVGLPWYGDSVRKSKVTEGLTLAALVKATVTGQFLGLDRTPGLVYHCRQSREAAPDCPIQYETVAISPSRNVSAILRIQSTIIVNYSAEVTGPNTGYSLVLVATQNSAGVTWQCLADAAADSMLSNLSGGNVPVQTALPAKWAPKECRTV
jgi:type IV pilus assembly protein PilA